MVRKTKVRNTLLWMIDREANRYLKGLSEHMNGLITDIKEMLGIVVQGRDEIIKYVCRMHRIS